jgi:hypothetical protein
LTDDDASLSLACMTTVAPFFAPGSWIQTSTGF